jgi:hypothetical protein
MALYFCAKTLDPEQSGPAVLKEPSAIQPNTISKHRNVFPCVCTCVLPHREINLFWATTLQVATWSYNSCMPAHARV